MNPEDFGITQDDIINLVESSGTVDRDVSVFQIADAVETFVPSFPVQAARDSVSVYLGPPTSGAEQTARDTVGFYLGPPTAAATGGGNLDPSTLTSLYLQTFGRPPDANEMASDLDNARRYGDAGVIRGIQLRAGNVAGSGVRGDEFLPSLQPTQDQVVMALAGGGISSSDVSSTEGWRDILGGIVGLLPFPGAPEIGGIIGGVPSLAQPRLPMPAPPQGRLPAPRTPPIIDVPMPRPPSRGGMTAGRAAAIIAAAAAAGLTVEQYLALHPGLKRRHRMNPLNPRALMRAFRRIDGFGHFVKRTIHLEQHAPRPKKHAKGFLPRKRRK